MQVSNPTRPIRRRIRINPLTFNNFGHHQVYKVVKCSIASLKTFFILVGILLSDKNERIFIDRLHYYGVKPVFPADYRFILIL